LESQLVKRSVKKYCSRSCELEYKQRPRRKTCQRCGIPFLAHRGAIGRKQQFCSTFCHREFVGSPARIDGRSTHPQYDRWYNMVARCTNPTHPSYKNYGGRGIIVCGKWLDPLTFFQYLGEELGDCPEGHSIDRIDNDGNYEPGNIRWASLSEQNSNQRRGPRKAKP
jgi:hypothetical protein